MKVIISTQNYLNFPSGINKFIKEYSSKLGKVYFISRENIKKKYKLNGVEINISKILKKIKPDVIHLHSVLDSIKYAQLNFYETPQQIFQAQDLQKDLINNTLHPDLCKDL